MKIARESDYVRIQGGWGEEEENRDSMLREI